MNIEEFWKLVRKYNILMKEAIDGPNCIDSNTCYGDCCSIKIDVPKTLAEEYFKRSYGSTKDFIRSNVFSFHLRFDEQTGKCFLFDRKINGCSVHESGIKPLQCWIYPTNFSNPENKLISCKRASGWKIIDINKASTAERLLKDYIKYCEDESKRELNKVSERINESSLKSQLTNMAPSQLGGFKDTWDGIETLSAEGFSLQMRKFCMIHNKQCKILLNNFIECTFTCDIIAFKLIDFLNDNLLKYIEEIEPDVDGNYPLFKLFNFINNGV